MKVEVVNEIVSEHKRPKMGSENHEYGCAADNTILEKLLLILMI